MITDVFADHDSGPAPELIVVNKTDAASGRGLAKLRRALPGALFVSAHTGDGVDALRRKMAELAAPTDTAVDVVIPYDRGDLVSRVHADGRVQETEHISDGTRIKARVPVALAASLRPFSANGQGGREKEAPGPRAPTLPTSLTAPSSLTLPTHRGWANSAHSRASVQATAVILLRRKQSAGAPRSDAFYVCVTACHRLPSRPPRSRYQNCGHVRGEIAQVAEAAAQVGENGTQVAEITCVSCQRGQVALEVRHPGIVCACDRRQIRVEARCPYGSGEPTG